ncbi:transposase [Atopobium sp. oral taxon 416]|nr:transposase [Atopobium sp. oral taxon 416]
MKSGASGLSRSQISRMCAPLDHEVEKLRERHFENFTLPLLWLDVTCIKCKESCRVSNPAVVRAIILDDIGYRHVVGLSVLDTENCKG